VEKDIVKVVDFIDRVIANHDNDEVLDQVRTEVNEMMSQFPIFASKVEA
jgi:glycine hydroxymethyltransferase